MQCGSIFGASPFQLRRLCIALASLLMTKRVLYLNDVILLFSFVLVNMFLKGNQIFLKVVQIVVR